MTTPVKRFKKTRWLFSWLSPFGISRTIYQREIASRILNDETEIDYPENVRRANYATLIACALVILACGYFLTTAFSDSTRTTTSPLLFVAFVAIVASVIKAKIALSNVTAMNRRLSGQPPKQRLAKAAGIDQVTLNVLLFKVTAYRNLYFLGGLFAFLLSLSPNNINEALAFYQHIGHKASQAFLTFILIVMLVAVMVLLGLKAQIHRHKILKAGANTDLVGYTTLHNHYKPLLTFTAIMLCIAIAGDILIALITDSSLSFWFIAAGRITLFILLVWYSRIGFRSCGNMCSMDAADHPDNALLSSFLLLNPIALPSPDNANAPVNKAPLDFPIMSVSILFFAALWIASEVNWASLLLVITALMPLAMVLAIYEFNRFQPTYIKASDELSLEVSTTDIKENHVGQ